jgi:hypothetical protein
MTHTESSAAVETLWRDHCAVPFPKGLAGEEIAGICLVSLDTFAAGCIQTFLGYAGKLDDERLAVLDSCSRELAVVVPQLNGEGKDYFSRLEKLMRLVLETVRDRGSLGRTRR